LIQRQYQPGELCALNGQIKEGRHSHVPKDLP
jgi:hypothetical protein